jgi:hypothetical protein
MAICRILQVANSQFFHCNSPPRYAMTPLPPGVPFIINSRRRSQHGKILYAAGKIYACIDRRQTKQPPEPAAADRKAAFWDKIRDFIMIIA